MSNRIYCLKCNSATLYESTPPKFCSNCSKPYLNSEGASIIQPIQSTPRPLKRPQRQIEHEDNDYTEPSEVPDIDKLEFDISANLRPNRETISLDMSKDKNSVLGKVNKSNKKVKSIPKKQVENNWKANFPKNVRTNSTEV